jgi:hypothetical protein
MIMQKLWSVKRTGDDYVKLCIGEGLAGGLSLFWVARGLHTRVVAQVLASEKQGEAKGPPLLQCKNLA